MVVSTAVVGKSETGIGPTPEGRSGTGCVNSHSSEFKNVDLPFLKAPQDDQPKGVHVQQGTLGTNLLGGVTLVDLVADIGNLVHVWPHAIDDSLCVCSNFVRRNSCRAPFQLVFDD